MQKASGVVVSWHREQNIAQIVRRMLDQEFITDVVIWNNDKLRTVIAHDVASFRSHSDPENGCGGELYETEDEETGKRIVLVDSYINVKTLGRFAATALTEQDIIATCDDDYLVNNWQQIAERFEGHNGKTLVAAAARGHVRAWQERRWAHEDAELALLGWGSMFDRRWWPAVRDAYAAQYGKDLCYYGKADRLFSIGLNRGHDVFHEDTDAMGATDRDAIYRQPGHVVRINESHARAFALLS